MQTVQLRAVLCIALCTPASRCFFLFLLLLLFQGQGSPSFPIKHYSLLLIIWLLWKTSLECRSPAAISTAPPAPHPLFGPTKRLQACME